MMETILIAAVVIMAAFFIALALERQDIVPGTEYDGSESVRRWFAGDGFMGVRTD